MTRLFRSSQIAAAAAAVLLSLSAVACSAGDGSDDPAPSDAATAQTSPGAPGADGGASVSPGSVPQPFGPECPNLPDSGEGSLQNLREQDWVTALAQVPALSQLSVTTALAELGDDFRRVQDVTVFAPTDGAFRSLGVVRARELLVNPTEAADVLRYHVVPGELAPEELPGSHETLAGQSLEVTGSGEDFMVDGRAAVVCGNLKAQGATIYLVNQVLQPS